MRRSLLAPLLVFASCVLATLAASSLVNLGQLESPYSGSTVGAGNDFVPSSGNSEDRDAADQTFFYTLAPGEAIQIINVLFMWFYLRRDTTTVR
jgi:hypothetical protein